MLVLGTALVLSLVKLDDYDIWWHLKCGEIFLKEGRIIRSEFFSYTAQGAPWVNGYILAQVFFYLFFRLGGYTAISVAGALMVVLIFTLSFLFSINKRSAFSLFVMLLAIFLSRDCFFPRPALFTPLFGVISFHLLDDFVKNGSKKIWWLIPITVLWVNCHPAFFVGQIITTVYLIGNLRHSALRKKLLLVLLVQFTLSLVNPYGINAYYSIFELAFDPLFKTAIVEWRSPFLRPKEPAGIIPSFVVLVTFGLFLFSLLLYFAIKHGKKFKIEYLLLFAFTVLVSVIGRRNLFLFGVFSAPLLTRAYKEITSLSLPIRATPKQISYFCYTMIMAMSMFVIWIAGTDRLYFYTRYFRSTGTGIQYALFPEGAVNFLKINNVKGNIFHPYGLGGYLIFKLYPDFKVFIDGRIFPYGSEVFELWSKASSNPTAFDKICLKYDINAVFLPVNPPENFILITHLIHSSQWAVVHADESGILFLRTGGEYDELISSVRLDLLHSPPALPMLDTPMKYRFWNKARFPYGLIWYSMLYERLGEPKMALSLLKRAIYFRPHYKDFEIDMAGLMIKAGKIKEGHELITRELSEKSHNPKALKALADYYMAVRDFRRAEELLLELLKKTPDSAEIYGYLGVISYNLGETDIAILRFQKAISLDNENYTWWEKLGITLQRTNNPLGLDALKRAKELMIKKAAPAKEIERITNEIKNYQSK